MLGHEISHKDVAAQDLDRDPKSRGNSKDIVIGAEYDYENLDNDMK